MVEKQAVILGSTGLIGKELLLRLVEEPTYSKIYVVGRRAPAFQHPKLETEILPLDRLHESTSLPLAHHVFCCLGTTIKTAGSEAAFAKVDLEAPVTAAKTALTGRLEKFLIVTAMGADVKSRIFYN